MTDKLSADACRAGRALARWSIRDLAERSGVAFTTIHKLEKGVGPRASTAAKIVRAFDAAGVTILVGRGGDGAVRRAPGSPSAAAVEGVAAEAIVDFIVRILRVARTGDRAAGVGGAQLSTMSMIRYNPGISLKALARLEGVTHPTMSRMVAAMVKAGLVARGADPKDARFSRLSLTPSGLDVWDSARLRRVSLIARLVERLSPAAVAELVSVLQPLADRIGAPPVAPRSAHETGAAAA